MPFPLDALRSDGVERMSPFSIPAHVLEAAAKAIHAEICEQEPERGAPRDACGTPGGSRAPNRPGTRRSESGREHGHGRMLEHRRRGTVCTMTQPLRNLACKLWDGHEWGAWDDRRWENLLGLSYSVRWCRKCGTRDIAAWDWFR